MTACTFFGHRNAPSEIKPLLRFAIEHLILTENVTVFYVGNQGNFDVMVRSILREYEEKYQIRYAVVLAYLPKPGAGDDCRDTMIPEGQEQVHPHYAISTRNEWLLENSSHIIAYIRHNWGGAAQYVQKAQRKGKHIISL